MVSNSLPNRFEAPIVLWTARVLSSLLAAFVISLFLFNEDVRQTPNWPTFVLLFLSLGLLSGWYRAQWAAWIGFAGGPFMFATLLLFAQVNQPGVTIYWPVLLLSAAAMSSIFVLLAWLYASAHRVLSLQGGGQHASPPRARLVLIILLVTVIIILLAGASFITPVSTAVDAPPQGNVELDQITASLRARGAVIGIASPPVEHPVFSVPGTALLVDEMEVWLFAYPDVAAATVDARAIYYGEGGFSADSVIQHGNVLLAFADADAQTNSLLIELFGPPVGEADD